MHSRRLLPGYALGLAALAYCGVVSAKGLYPTQFFSTLNGPAAVVNADVNGDGKLDLVEIGTDQTIAVLINNGDGTFKSPIAYYVAGTQPEALAVADLNRDGNVDIVVVDSTDNNISVLLGVGDGTFKAQTADQAANSVGTPVPTYPTGLDPVAITIADLNGDGVPDVITANFNDNTLSVLIGRGDGTLKPEEVVPVGVGPIFVAVADMNNDGKPDILVNNNLDDNIGVLLNAGGGAFKAMTTTRLGPQLPTSQLQMMVVGDFNRDGKQDVITTSTDVNGDSVIYLPGLGDGRFKPGHFIETGLQSTYLAVADVDGDGLQDLIAGSLANGTVRVLRGNSNGGFGSGVDYPANGIAGALEVQGLTVADFRGTGKPDIAVVNADASLMQLLYNDGTGHFHLQNSYTTGNTPSDVQTADLNGDGHLDLVETDSADNTLSVRLGNGDGTFQVQQTFKVGANPQRVLLADLNGDGILDAVTVNSGDNSVSVLLGDGLGGFGAAHDFEAGSNAVDIGIADMDHDGKLDLVVANAVVNTVSILRGNGDGTFRARVSYPSSTQINGLAVGDVEQDGFPDVVTVGGNVAVLKNDHKGGLITPTLNHSGTSVDIYGAVGVRVSLADVNNNHHLDILIADSSDSELVVMTGNGKGFFATVPSPFPTCANPRSITVADLNADSDPDVVVSCSGSSAVGVMLGNGKGGFLSSPYATEIGPRGVAIGDFDEDGQPDLAVVNGDSDDVNVMTEIHGVVAADQAPRALPTALVIPDGRQPAISFFPALDVDGDTLTYVVTTLPLDGTLSYGTTTGIFNYQANTGVTGLDTMSFQVSDGVKLSNIATIPINVQKNPVGDSGGGHSFLGAFWLPMLPLLGLFLGLRRRRRTGLA
ncbi:MAG TPA: FG-GAP-like repeat-containing protein [Gammaproteobacteria bacterium]|jgi:hypothetical protein